MKSKIIKVIFIKILAVSLFLFHIFPINVYAHEFDPPRYWNDIYFHPEMLKHIVRLRVNMTNVTNEVYNRKLHDAINDWDIYDGGFCDIATTTSSTTLMAYDTYPSSKNQDAYAVTTSTLSNATITYYPYGITGGVTTKNCKKITKAVIYVNIEKQRSANFGEGDIAKTWVHELGHVMGLNETNDGTQSVMKQGKGSNFDWDEYWKPQTHDIWDMARYKYVVWD